MDEWMDHLQHLARYWMAQFPNPHNVAIMGSFLGQAAKTKPNFHVNGGHGWQWSFRRPCQIPLSNSRKPMRAEMAIRKHSKIVTITPTEPSLCHVPDSFFHHLHLNSSSTFNPPIQFHIYSLPPPPFRPFPILRSPPTILHYPLPNFSASSEVLICVIYVYLNFWEFYPQIFMFISILLSVFVDL